MTPASQPLRPWALLLVGLTPLIVVFDTPRHWVEGRMLPHMLLQFPWLMLAGAACACAAAVWWPRLARVMGAVNRRGLLGVVMVSGVSGLWMVPAALDAALIDPLVAAAKYASWWLAGAALLSTWPRLVPAMRLFFIGNLAWMFATAGLLYADAEQRLCVNYLQDEQLWTGGALMIVGVGLLTGWVLSLRYPRSLRHP